jgi:chaperonin cofactor prefoldin
LQNQSYGVKDTSVSLGTALAADPARASSDNSPAPARSVDMHIKNRPSALHSSPELIGSNGFMVFEKRCPVEVDRNGIYIPAFDTGPNFASGVNKKGLFIKGGSAIKVQCTLPASLVITLPIAIAAGEGSAPEVIEDSSRARTGSLVDAPTSGIHHGIDDASSICEWLGERSGANFQQIDVFFRKLYGSGLSSITELHVSVACGDRIQRDALALTIRALASLDPSVSLRARMETLPWYSADGASASSAPVESTASNEMYARLKDLESEMRALKQQRDELTLQLLEASGAPSASASNDRTVSGEAAINRQGSEERVAMSRSKSIDETGEGSMRDLAKIQALEMELQALRDGELHLEKKSIELQSKIKRLTEEKDLHVSLIFLRL